MKRATLFLNGLLAVGMMVMLAGCADGNLIEMMTHGWGLGIIGTIIVILDILAILEIVGSDRSFGSKAIWSLIIVFFPVLGLLFYWFFGK